MVATSPLLLSTSGNQPDQAVPPASQHAGLFPRQRGWRRRAGLEQAVPIHGWSRWEMLAEVEQKHWGRRSAALV
jgi:hypothetical protein